MSAYLSLVGRRRGWALIRINTVYKLYKGDNLKQEITDLDPVVERPISTSSGLNFSSSFFFVCSKAFPRAIFSQLFLEHSINKLYAKRMKLNVVFKLLYLNSNFTLTLGYLDLPLNKLALIMMAYTVQMSLWFYFNQHIEMKIVNTGLFMYRIISQQAEGI